MPTLPFKVGDLIESKSFEAGYRGAWFSSKIVQIGTKAGAMAYQLVYPEYPDQKPAWIKVYQKPPNIGKSKAYRELVMRPHFPTIYRESEKLDVGTISEVIVIVNDTWRVGDLVDWLSDGCNWCGKVTKILGNGKVQVGLPLPPLGEGSTYTALTKDLRPSLEWSPEKGWTVPMEDGCRRTCARILNPANSGRIANIDVRDEAVKVGKPTIGMSCLPSPQDSIAGRIPDTNAADGAVKVGKPTVATVAMSSLPSPQDSEGLERSKERRNNYVSNDMQIDKSDIDASTGESGMDASTENLERATIHSGKSDEYLTKMRSHGSICLNSMSSNTIEAAILDLEELVNRVKWLKDVLNMGVPLSSTKHPSWEFLQHQAPCKW